MKTLLRKAWMFLSAWLCVDPRREVVKLRLQLDAARRHRTQFMRDAFQRIEDDFDVRSRAALEKLFDKDPQIAGVVIADMQRIIASYQRLEKYQEVQSRDWVASRQRIAQECAEFVAKRLNDASAARDILRSEAKPCSIVNFTISKMEENIKRRRKKPKIVIIGKTADGKHII